MDVNSRDPSQNIIPFRIKGVEVARFDICGNLGIGTNAPSANLEVAGTVKINGELYVNGRALNSLTSGVVVNIDSQPAPATALNRQKKQSIPLATASTLSTSDIIAKMSGVSVGKTQTYGVGPAQMASYGNIVVAVGDGTNSIAYSLVNPPTASSWVGISNSSNTFTSRGNNIAYANGTWVAVGEGTNCIAYSTMTPPIASSWVGIPTGSSFNGVTNTFSGGTRGNDIAYGNGIWVAVGTSTNSIAYSLANPPTAESWIGIPSSGSNFSVVGTGIIFGNGTWVATGRDTNSIAYSTRTPPTSDSWVVVPLGVGNDAGANNVFTTGGINIIYANGVWLAAGYGTNVLCYSIENPPIASSWMPITTGVLFGTLGRSLAYGNGTWVACGESGTLLAYSTSRIPHSSSWVAMKGPTPSSSGELINHVGFNASTNTWYFLGDIGNNCMFYSTATPPVPATWIGVQKSAGVFSVQAYGAIGITTNAFTSPINVARLDNKVTFPVNRMLAVGGGGGGDSDILARSSASPAPAITGTISYSDDDGATWAMVPGGATNVMFSSAADIAAGTSFGVGGSQGANAVAWNGEKWVAAGNGRTNSLAFSDDGGMTWSGITGKSVFSVEARDVAWNGQMWVAVGRGINFSTAYSYDGITWMGPVDVSGVPVNVFSYDIAGPTAAMSDISGGGNHVTWTGKIWVATGTRTLIAGSSPAAYYTVAYSVDGKTWTGVADSGATSTGFDMYAYGAAWNGRNLIVTGRGTTNTLAFSTASSSSSSSWVGLGNTVFSVWGRGITWGARRWMATGRGTNTVAFSTNGRNWQGCGANVFKPMRRFMAMGDTGLYTGVASGQPQRGVAFSYSDDGVTWDAPVVNQGVEMINPLPLYSFSTFTFTTAGTTGRTGPSLATLRANVAYSSTSWATDTTNNYLNMARNGIQLWTVPVTGTYTIRAVGAAGGNPGTYCRGRDIQTSTVLTKGEVIQILVGQQGVVSSNSGGGGGGTFVVRGTSTPIIVAGGGGGRGQTLTNEYINSNASSATSGNKGGNGASDNGDGGINGGGGGADNGGGYAGGGGGLLGNGATEGLAIGGSSFINGGIGGGVSGGVGGFGGGGHSHDQGSAGGGGGYSGGGGGRTIAYASGGGGGSYAISTMIDLGAINTVAGSVTITLNAIIIIPVFSSSFLTSSTLFTNNTLFTNAITDNASTHTALMYSIDAGASWSRVPGSSDASNNGGTGMTVANGGCYSIATNTTRTRFIAGGGDSASATSKVYFSNDGFNWNRSVSSPNTSKFAWVYASLWVGGGYNRWLIGGNDVTTQTNGRIMYSGDADAVAAWIDASAATYTGTIISCFAANTDFTVILAGAASGNKIYRSAINGGATWTTTDISNTPIGSVRSIAFSPSLGRWVAVGGGGGAANTIIYSTDATATAWIAPPIQAKAMPTAIFKNGSEVTRVIWDALNGGRFIIGGYNGVSDYASFTNVAGADSVNNNPGYTMAYSTDGVNWTPVTIRASDAGSTSSGPFMTRCREIMALDVSGEYTPINTGYSVTWNSYANRFVATGNGTTPVVYSSDGGATWTPANQQPPQQAIAVAGGASAAANTTSVSPITYTIDGKTWSQGIGAKEIFGAGGTVLCVKYGQTSTAISPNGRIWVAGATNGSNSCLAFSQNGIRWTAIANANTMITNVRTIAYAPADQLRGNASITASSGVGNGVWVAGGDTTNSLIFSYDGISWSEVSGSLTILNQCNACAFGNGVFVAGGTAGTTDPTAILAYSIDGINWQPIRGTISRISSGASIKCITYGRDERGRGLWVAGVSSASGVPNVSLLYSYNGIDWIGVNNSSSLSTIITEIAYGVSATTGQGLWVASVYNSSSYSFLFSTTGRDGWTTVTNTKTGLFESSGSGATGIVYSNGIWYATGLSAGVSTGRTLAYSYQGNGGWFGVYPSSNMYGAVIPTFSATTMYCIATTNDYMIPSSAAGSPTAMVPVRSIGWTAGVGSVYLQHPTLLFGTASTTSTTTAAATAISSDGGRSWGSSVVSLGTSAFRGGVCNDAFWNGAIWVAVGYDAVSGAKVATSKDGVTWSQIPAGAVPISGILYSVMWNGTVWMVGGDGSPTNDANTASIAWSSDLLIWNAVTNTDTKLYLVKRISWNGMYWVAVGLGTVSTMMYSKDLKGLIWEDTYVSSSSTNKTATITSAVNDVVWGGGRWVAVGRGNDIVGGGGVSVLYSADTPVVGGEPAEYAITGRRWTGVASSASMFPYGASSVCWNGKRFVATGPAYSSKSGPAGNIIAWSADGISWTAYSTTKTVAPGQRWVAVGSGSAATIATSADGRTWTDVSGSSFLFSDISGASAALVNTMGTGARAIGWNGNSLIVGGARSATTRTDSSLLTATATTGRTTIPVCAFIGSGNGVMGGGTTNVPMDATAQTYIRNSSSVFITHLDVNMREASAPYANMWLNTYTDLSATQLFQVTPEFHSFSSALKWNGWSWVANFGMTTSNPLTGEKYGSIWYCTDPLARVGWSVASNYATPQILMGQGGYAGLEWNGAAWLACGYDPNNNNLIYTTDKYGAVGWTAVSGIVSSGSASFQPVCIASSSRFWVVGGSQGTTSALYYTNDRTGATGWNAISTAGSVLPGIRITSVGYNGTAWICCGGGRIGTDNSGGFSSGSISWRVDGDDIGTGWAASTVSGSSGGFPSLMSTCSAITYNAGAASPIWVVVGDVSGSIVNQVAYTTSLTGSIEWKTPSGGNSLGVTLFSKLNGIAWTGYSWIASCGAGFSRIASTTDINVATGWNNGTNGIYAPTLCTNAVTYANIPISLLTTGMVSSAGVGAGSGAMWRGGVGRAQGLLPGGGSETTSVVVRSSNGAEGITWSQTYSRNFLIAVGGGTIRDASGGGGANRMAYSYDGGLTWTTNNSAVLTTASGSSVGSIRTVKYSNGIWVAGGDSTGSSVSSNNCLAWSRDGVNWTGAGGTQIFGSAGACYAVCCNDRGRWVAVGGAPLTTAGTYTNVSGSIYTMAWSDDGMNWTPVLGSRALFGIVCQGVSYGADASGVGMWTAIGRGGAYTGCAYSYDGKTWFLSQTSGSLFGTSVNVLTERYAPVVGDWRTVSINSTGQYQFAAANAGLVWRSTDYGVTWSALTLASRNWVSVAVSSTGQYVVTVSSDGSTDRLYNSSDYGVTWVGRGFASNTWVQVAISASGQYQCGVSSNLAIQSSRDYGVTWNSISGTAGVAWTGIAISSSGQYITAVINSNPYVSSDYGVSWLNRDTSRSWNYIAMSSTGQIQIAGLTTSGVMYISTDYGVSFTNTGSSPSVIYRSVAISSTGQYRSGVTNSLDTIKRSNNYDTGWTSVNPAANYYAIAMSATGQYQTAVSQTSNGLIFISSNFGETWSSGATDSRSLGITYGKDASGAGMWVATAGRRDRDVAASAANTMAYSYDGKLWRGIAASAGLSEQAWTVAYGKDGFGVGMWVAGGYDRTCGLKWSYDGVSWNATTGASGASVWTGMAAGRRVLSVYWNGSMWLASTSDTRNGEPRGTGIAANNASSAPGYLLYSYNGKNWLPVLSPNTYAATISVSTQTSVYSVLPNPAILDFGSFYDDSTQRGAMIANTTARTVGAVLSNVPIENVNTIVPYGRGSLTTGQVPFLMGGDSGLMDSSLPITSDIASTTSSLSTSTDGGITWRAVPNSTRVMTKVNKILCDETTQQIVAVGAGNYSVATSTPARAADADGWVGVFGSRMTNTRAGLFEKYGTSATWFGGAKMWIASGRTQSRRGSSLAVSVNGTVWQDAKIVSQMAAGASLGGRGGGLTNRMTTGVTMNSSVIPYTAPATPLLTYTDSAAAFSTQVSSVATNSQYNRAVVGGSGVQFVAGGRGIGSNGSGLVYSNDGQNWTAVASGAATVFQTPTNVAAYSTSPGSGGFDAAFGTVALTQRLTPPATYVSGSWLSGSLSSTGQYQSVVVGSGNIWTSSNFGVTWTERTTGSTRSWSTISLSSTGQYQSAVVDGRNIWTSSDFGVTWTERTTGSTREWKFISLSSTGQYQSAVVNGGNIWTSSDFGVTWTERSGPGSGLSISLSRTGQYQSTGKSNGGKIWTSSDYGVSWTSISSTPGDLLWVSISLSGTGQYQSAVEEFYASTGGKIWTSSNFGVTWTERTAPGSQKWYSISLSSTGQYQSAVVDGGNIWTSSDFGVSWTSRATTLKWNSISLSSSGQYQNATAYGAGSTIWTSTNFGVTWVQRSTATKTNAFTRIKSSASGQYQLATSGPVGDTNGQLYVSSDYGQTWMPRRGLSTWLGGSVSATGAVMMGIILYKQPVKRWTFTKLQNGDGFVNFVPIPENNSTSLHFSLRFTQGLTLFDTYTNGSWGGSISVTDIHNLPNPSTIYFSFDTVNGWKVEYTVSGVAKSVSIPNRLGITSIDNINNTPNTDLGSKASITGPDYPNENATILRSTDYGNTFSDVPGTGLTYPAYWRSVSATNSASTQTALAYGSSIYRSSDTGATWSNAGITIDGSANANTVTPRNWQDVAVAAETGAVQVTCVSGGYLYYSGDTGATWVSSTVSIDGVSPQTTNRAWQAVALSANGQYGLACVNSTTASGFLYRLLNYGASWASANIIIDGTGVQTTNRAWQDVGMSANGKYQVACVGSSGFIYYSKDYGASWTSLSVAGSRSWSSVALSENGGTISATTNDASGGVWTYTMPDDQYYRPPALLNTSGIGGETTSTIRAITYGNSGTGAATDGYWVAGADASANTLAYSSNGVDWTAVAGSKTTLFNSVNGVAYGADLSGTPLWVAVGAPFVGSVPGSTAYSIAYSYNMTNWTGVRNLANFTGQGNHVAYGQDEYGTGMWVAVGQGSGALAANLGSSSLYNSNSGSTGGGTPSTTIFYSYDGTNWSAGQGAGVFSTSGTDIAWGVDASGVATWVATGVGYTDLLTGVVIPGGQVAYSTNGRLWTPIRSPTAIVPAQTPTTLTSRINVLPAPPTSTGFVTSIFGTTWSQLGVDILGTQDNEYSGIVSLSADGTTVAIGSSDYDVTGANNEGRVRVYKYNGTTSTWGQLGLDISGTQVGEYSGYSVSLSADGTTVAIGSSGYNNAGNDEGRTRVYKYNGTTWGQLGLDISGTQAGEESGYSVSLSADGTVVAIGSRRYNISGIDEGRTRVYKYNGTSWGQLGLDISGNQADEWSGFSVSISADGTTVAIGSRYYDVTGFNNEGRTRVYKYNGTTWGQLGLDISGNQAGENSGYSVSLSADGTIVAIGSYTYDKAGGTTNTTTEEGRTRIYKYNGTTWGQLGLDISGNQAGEYSGFSVSISADGTTVVIGSVTYDNAGGTTDAGTNEGRTRVYKYNGTTWGQLGLDISGNQPSENSGGSVSISADGTTVAIGSRAYDKAGGTTDTSTNEGRTRIYKLDVTGAFFSSSNPTVADICGNGLLIIKDISAGTTTITATQTETPPFSLVPVTVQGTLTVTGTVYTLVYHTVFSTFTPFTTSALTVAYGRRGSQGTGAPLWMVGGSGGNVFAMSSTPTTTGAWSVIATASAPFPICNSIGYSNGIWVAGNNTDATNVLARSIDGGSTWTPVPLSSVSGFMAGSASVGANAFCNYSLAYADYSNDTNLRSWISIQGTKNFMFEGGVNTVATVTTNIVASTYNNAGAGTRAWWVAGGSGTSGAALAYSTDPSGATGWTKSESAGIASLVAINDVAFSPQTQQWLAVGAGASGSTTQNILFSDASGATWTASAVATPATPVITLNTCIWNQLDASASAAGRWIAGGTRNDISVSIPTSATLYISTDTSGAASPWTPIAGTGAILSQVYSAAFNGRVWIAAGVPASDSGSTSTLMSTSDPTGAAGWQGIATTNASISGFDTAARSITWNADQQMWIATGENTATAGSGAAVDASFSSVIYSLDVSGSTGTWRTVRESNSTCFSGQGNGIAFTGQKWFAVGEGTNQIVATTDMSANTAFGTGAAPSWSSAGNANTVLPVRGTDITFTGRNLVATGVGSGSSSGVVISTDPTGSSWSTAAAGFTDASGGGTSITFEPTYDGAGRLVATGKSATNSITVSSDSGATWNTSATTPATGVQLSSQRTAPVATTQSLFTTGGNNVAYVGNDTLLGGGGNDVHWTGKRWIATGKNSGVDTTTTTTAAVSTSTAPDITNNNTSTVAVSDDGITWQCVSSGQAPNITEGIFVATNSRVGATPLIDSRITIMDGGDTEPMTSDYSSSGGMGAGIAQLDLIAELPVTSVSASNTTATVATIGVGSNNTVNSVNGVGVTPVASFDNTAFTITTRPV